MVKSTNVSGFIKSKFRPNCTRRSTNILGHRFNNQQIKSAVNEWSIFLGLLAAFIPKYEDGVFVIAYNKIHCKKVYLFKFGKMSYSGNFHPL